MEEYKNNSNKFKEESKNIEKVISGTAKVKKKNEMQKFASVFISEDVKSVKSYIITDVLIPGIKKAITETVNLILYGESKSKSNNSTSPKPSYRSYYDSNNNTSNTAITRRSAYSYDNIVVDNRADAEEVLDNMNNIIRKYGIVSVADMYDLVGIVGNYTDNKYGWTDLRTAKIERERDGGYRIDLPRALPL